MPELLGELIRVSHAASKTVSLDQILPLAS
jgi:hypothetical protein